MITGWSCLSEKEFIIEVLYAFDGKGEWPARVRDRHKTPLIFLRRYLSALEKRAFSFRGFAAPMEDGEYIVIRRFVEQQIKRQEEVEAYRRKENNLLTKPEDESLGGLSRGMVV